MESKYNLNLAQEYRLKTNYAPLQQTFQRNYEAFNIPYTKRLQYNSGPVNSSLGDYSMKG